MDDFKIIIDGKECSCNKRDRVCVELDNSIERSEVDFTELKHLVNSFNIPREQISCTIHIKKKSPSYRRIHKLFKKLLKECKQNENWLK